jgi:hypothetical protein
MAHSSKLFASLCAAVLTLVTTNSALAEPPAVETAVHKQVARTERAIDRRFDNLEDVVDSTPMPLTGVTRGGYLKGFGVVFTVEVNLLPVPNLGPFSGISAKQKTSLNLRKRQRLEDLEIRARTILVDEGPRLTEVPAAEKVALVISLLHYPWEDVSGLPSQLVMQAGRQLLIDHQAGRVDLPALKKQLETAYF